MANEIAKAYVQIIPSANGISGSLTSLFASESVSAGLNSGSSMGTALLSGLKKMLPAASIAGVTAAIVKAIKECVDEAMDFDASMSQVAATMGTTTDAVSELTDFAKEMGRTTAFSAEEAAEGLNTLALAGLDADEQMAVLPTVLNLASAGCLDLDDAASYVTGTIKGFGASMEDAEYYADLMAKGATLANTDVNDLGEALSGAAATAASYGQEADSVTLSLLRLAEQNVTGSEAATALNRAMADLYTPTDAAKSALQELGVACYDANGEARDFNDIVDELDSVLSEYDTETRKAYEDTIFTTKGMQAFDKMTSSSAETVEGFKDALADCSGSAMEQAATQLDNLKGDMTLFGSAMSGLKIEVGEALTPMLRDIVQFGTNAVTAFTDIISGSRSVGEVFSDMVTNIVDKIGLTDWPGLGNLINAGINGGIVGLVEEVPSLMSNFVQTIDGKIRDTDWHALGKTVADTIIGGLVSIISDIPGKINEITSTIVQFLQNVDWKQVGYDVMTYVLTGIRMIIVDIPKAIGEIVTSIWDKITETDWLELGGNIVQGIIQGILNIIPNLGSMIGEFCSGLLNAFKDFFKIGSPSKLMEEQGGYLVDGLEQGLKSMPDAINNPLKNALSNAAQWGSNMLQSGLSTASNFVSKISSGLSNLTSTVSNPLSSSESEITKWGSNMSSEATKLSSQFVEKFNSGLSSLSSKVKSQLSNVTTEVKSWGNSLTSSMTSIGSSMITGMISGLNSKSSSLYSTIKSICNQAIATAKAAMETGSPSRVFRDEIGAQVGAGFALGLEDSTGLVMDAMDDMLEIPSVDMAGFDFSANGSLSAGSAAVYNVTQNIYSQAQTAAALMKEARYEARRAVMQGV